VNLVQKGFVQNFDLDLDLILSNPITRKIEHMPEGSGELLRQYGLETMAKPLKTKTADGRLFIGIPKESTYQERRVALTPSSVALLVSRGHEVVVETGAGEKCNFPDLSYTEAGAEIAIEKRKVFDAHIIIKLSPPTPEEIDLLQNDQIIFSTLHLPTLEAEYLEALMKKKVTAISYEYLMDKDGSFPIVRILSEIAGNAAVLIASEHLSNSQHGRGILLGGVSGIPPAKVVILGAGVVGEYAAHAALGLGAEVRVFDNNMYKLMRLQNNLGRRIYTSNIIPQILKKELRNAAVAIGAIHSELGRSPCVVSEEMVANMKPGSVIIDVSIDQGGCFETSELCSHKEPTFLKHDIIHYCVPNITSRYSRTASLAFSNVITSLLLEAQEQGSFERLLANSSGTRHGVYVYRGVLTNQFLSERFDIKSTDLDLFMTAQL